MALGRTVVWPKIVPGSGDRWLWGRRIDLAWVAGGGFFLFVLVAFPLSFFAATGPLLTTAFLHLAIVCNYPHYSATYEVILRERAARPRPFRVLLYSTPIILGIAALAARFPDLLWGPIVRVYLCWSAHHYAAQNFGVSSMYAARAGKPLQGRERSLFQIAFLTLGIFFIVVSNTAGGDPETSARVIGLAENGGAIPSANFPAMIYLVALALVPISIGCFVFALRMRRARTSDVDTGILLLYIVSLAWFVVPNIRGPGGAPWMWPGLTLALLGAPPFFHCAQYLAVCAHRDRQFSDVRPIWLFAGLVFGGFALFHGPPHAVAAIFPIDALRATLLVVAMVNLHHFWLDGVMWKRPAPKPVA